MRVIEAVLASLVGSAMSAGMAPRSANDAIDSVLAVVPKPNPNAPAVCLPWEGPDFPQPPEDFHRGLQWEQVCWYFSEFGLLAQRLQNATYECDVDNTIYWVEDCGPWKYVERGYFALARGFDDLQSKLVRTDPFRNPIIEENIIQAAEDFALKIREQLWVLWERRHKTRKAPYVARGICYALKTATIGYLSLSEHMIEKLGTPQLQELYRLTSGATWDHPPPNNSVLGLMLQETFEWCQAIIEW